MILAKRLMFNRIHFLIDLDLELSYKKIKNNIKTL